MFTPRNTILTGLSIPSKVPHSNESPEMFDSEKKISILHLE